MYILPNLFTTASLFTGFLAMLLAVQGNIEGSALAILFSALMDGLDGKVARLTNTASEFGIQYDSLADLVAFGVAPAFTSWMWVLEGYGKLGIGVAFLYVACTALRLARFNVCVTTVSKKFFVGLPCPAAGCAVAMFILFSSYLPSWLEARTPFLGLVVTFVMAIVFAILLNEVKSQGGKKVVQTISYLPHFLSWIIVTGILHDALSGTGIINELLVNFGILDQPLNFFAYPKYFWPIVAFANVWKETGWNAIIYLSAITAIDPSLYEAANMDGAGRWARIKYVTLPGIKPTIMILLLMNVGNVLNAGFEIQYLLGNGLVQSVSQTIDIYVLKWGISQNDFSIGTAAGIFKSLVSIILIVIANQIAKRNGEERLF